MHYDYDLHEYRVLSPIGPPPTVWQDVVWYVDSPGPKQQVRPKSEYNDQRAHTQTPKRTQTHANAQATAHFADDIGYHVTGVFVRTVCRRQWRVKTFDDDDRWVGRISGRRVI